MDSRSIPATPRTVSGGVRVGTAGRDAIASDAEAAVEVHDRSRRESKGHGRTLCAFRMIFLRVTSPMLDRNGVPFAWVASLRMIPHLARRPVLRAMKQILWDIVFVSESAPMFWCLSCPNVEFEVSLLDFPFVCGTPLVRLLAWSHEAVRAEPKVVGREEIPVQEQIQESSPGRA